MSSIAKNLSKIKEDQSQINLKTLWTLVVSPNNLDKWSQLRGKDNGLQRDIMAGNEN